MFDVPPYTNVIKITQFLIAIFAFFQGAMIDAGVLPALLTLATDGPYNTAEVSRESARILANLSSRMAARVIEVLGPRVAKNWMATVDCLVDERLKLHACRAKGYLQQEVTTV